MRLLTFVGTGVPRSGTRWLGQCLSEHPQQGDFLGLFWGNWNGHKPARNDLKFMTQKKSWEVYWINAW